MNRDNNAVLLYQKDFAEKGDDKYFVYNNSIFKQITANEVIAHDGIYITHDFWLIAPSIFKQTGSLPNVIDVTEVAKQLSARKLDDETIKKSYVNSLVKAFYSDIEDLNQYFEMYYRRSILEIGTYQLFSHKLTEAWEALYDIAIKKNEIDRIRSIEIPIFNLLTMVAVKGIRVDHEKLRGHKKRIDGDYYAALKDFGLTYDLQFSVPNKFEVEDLLRDRDYDLTEATADFIIEFLPMDDKLGENIINLRKIQKSRTTLANIPLSRSRICPIADTYATVSSRIYFKNPTIQNLAKKYRDIFIPDPDLLLTYVDYDQFEVGIMAAISEDPILKDIYEGTDIYKKFAIDVFNSEEKRPISKKLFLAFSYGMSLSNLLNSVEQNSGNRLIARDFFLGFETFIKWREEVQKEFLLNNKISSLNGNYLERTGTGSLSGKEMRSCISQVIQGTGSLIFKKALLRIGTEAGVSILIPMHDAVLVQRRFDYNQNNLVSIFQSSMNEVLSNKINSKASIERFY